MSDGLANNCTHAIRGYTAEEIEGAVMDIGRPCPSCAKLRSELDLARGAIQAQAARDLAATERLGETPYGCDTSDHLADMVLGLRAEVDRLRAALQPFAEAYSHFPTRSRFDRNHPAFKDAHDALEAPHD